MQPCHLNQAVPSYNKDTRNVDQHGTLTNGRGVTLSSAGADPGMESHLGMLVMSSSMLVKHLGLLYGWTP